MMFLITAATILEQMIRKLIKNPSFQIDYSAYQKKIEKYEPTLDGLLEDFENTVFGVHYNRRNR